ncbi:transposase domain-containing protein [Galbibacter sp.]|uniref:transposase domain-containing protein n=1 Tax=Galbibacter sp. TaxID=2918471 RepID=UPI002D1F9B2E|nr:transposase domain-containing protein [Galbibacter sp.]
MFCGSHRAAQHAAIFLSFFGSCKLHGVNPRVWLEETLSNIKEYKINDLEELLPGYQNES